jgi:hypothetical protein
MNASSIKRQQSTFEATISEGNSIISLRVS